MSEKKISFGFKQVKKQPLLLPTKIGDDKEKKNDIELIQCLEGQTIKLINEKEEKKPLIIPLLNSQKTSTALASLRNLKTVLNDEDQLDDAGSTQGSTVKPDTKSTESTEQSAPMTIEQQVIKELLNEAKNMDDENDGKNGEKLTLPTAADKLPLDGAKESTIDDYDEIPITQFGMAMLRGMGLKDEDIISKKNKEPELRPHGMGLGADKVIKKVKLLVTPAKNEKLEITKNAYVRILAGKRKDLYGQIEDYHASRVTVRLAVGGARETLNEFMVQPVSKQEFQEYGKVINSAKYEEYKRKQDEKEKEIKPEIKKEIKHERSKSRSVSRERDTSSTRRKPSPTHSNRRSDYSHHYDRYKSKDIERSSHKSRYESRRSRSIEKYSSSKKPGECSTDRYESRSKDDKYRSYRQKSKSPSRRHSSSDSDSSDDSRDKRSHHKKSKKKHKKKESKTHDSSDDDNGRNYKKKTKKSKRQRSRSRSRGRR